MAKFRPPHPPAFRHRMVELVRSGKTPEALSREFEPTAQSIRNRVAQADRDEGQRSDGLTTEERRELVRLQGISRRKGNRRTVRDKAMQMIPDLVKRDFLATETNRLCGRRTSPASPPGPVFSLWPW